MLYGFCKRILVADSDIYIVGVNGLFDVSRVALNQKCIKNTREGQRPKLKFAVFNLF